MDRARRLGSLWNWLPVFRAVAEVEHLNAAAKALHVSASAVSRTIRLLEDDVGHELFTRSGGSVRLNGRGLALLASVRDAMRLVDNGVRSISEPQTIGPVRVACAGDYPLTFLWRALIDLRRERPNLVAHISRPPFEKISALLLRGEIDIAFDYRAEQAKHLTVATIAVVTHGIYCGRAHALHDATNPTLDDVLAFPFVAPSANEALGSTDFWPADRVRSVSIFLPTMAPAIELCASGHALAVLPDRMPDSRAELRRLPVDLIAPVNLYAVYREPLGDHDIAEMLAASMKDQMHRSLNATSGTAE
jgi:DNA-binding transcriptional LysR family regulator